MPLLVIMEVVSVNVEAMLAAVVLIVVIVERSNTHNGKENGSSSSNTCSGNSIYISRVNNGNRSK